jgi:RNA polymerase sigma factor (sigma-70 family)
VNAPKPSLLQEQEWLLLAQRDRNHHAFAQLVTMHQGRVRAVLRKLTHGNQAHADELAQETFIKAWRALPGFQHDAQWSTWLHRIAYLEFLQHQRRWGKESGLTSHEAMVPAGVASQHAHDLRLDLEKALAQLHPLEKTAIVYCYHGGMNHSEVAHVMGLPLGTVKSHVLRGRAKLQKLLAAWKPDAHEEPT